MEDLKRWLQRLGLEDYAQTFAAHDIDRDILPSLSDADLERLGISLGHRRKIQRALEAESTDPDPASTAPRAGPDAERRIVTTVFCDLVGSTDLAARLDPEELRTLLAVYQDRCAAAVEAEDGYLARYIGDGLLVYFGYPRAHEDDAERAIRAALGMVRSVARIPRPRDVELAVRIGIATGPVVVGDIGQGERRETMAIVGETPNLAARLQALAEPGAIVVSSDTRELAGRLEFESLGEHALKGFATPVAAWRVLGVADPSDRLEVARRRGLSTLVGRSGELEKLGEAWSHARQGATTVVTIAGEAGVGKSRLVYEFRSRFDESRYVFLEGHCIALGRGRALFPFIDVVRRAFGIEPGDDAGTRERRLSQGLSMIGLPPEGHVPYLLTLLQGEHHPALDGLEDEVVGHGLRESLKAVLKARCQMGPLVLFLNDLHWADDASAEFLGEVLALDRLPLLVIVTFRPEHDPRWLARARGGAVHVALELEGLGRDDLRQIFLESLRSERDVASVADVVLDRLQVMTGGNPLFLEQMARHLLRTESLQLEGTDVVGFASGDTPVPSTLSGLLLQRVDELAPELRGLVQLAAVVGRQFSRSIVAALLPGTPDVDRKLELLCDGRLLEALSGARYRFHHALVQDAIYQSLLVEERVRRHGQVAEYIERDESIDWEERVVLLAEHYARARDHAKAFRYLTLAGKQSIRVYSLREAAASFRQALTLAAEAPDAVRTEDAIDTALEMSRVYYFMGWFEQQITFVREYVALAEELGDTRRLARLLFECGYCHVFRGRHTEGKALLERSRALCESLRDSHGVGLADLGLAWHSVYAGPGGDERRLEVRRRVRSALSAGREHRDSWLAAKAQLAQAQECMFYGSLSEARKRCSELLELSRQTNDTRPRAMALWQTAMVEMFDFDYSQAIFAATQANQVALSPVDRSPAYATHYCAMVMAGQAEQALGPLSQLRDRLDHEGHFGLCMLCDLYLGIGELMLGDMTAGMRRIDTTIARLERAGHESDGSVMTAIAYAALGEVYTEIALGTRKPRMDVVLGNLGFLLRTLPTARRRARRALERARDIAERFDAALILGWTSFNLARLKRGGRRNAAASALFERAAELAERAGAEGLGRRVARASA